ncbi:tetratricopeptide repeat protein [Secundilactobacillus oryzae]|uniref:tetratricopeptide repeat protein n=1 Tax=Secundilactobacillus oryzae TaxID=1202668 RepID=UPI0020920B99|nr:tetratricopeptide repeat protein [Secundilactobacillus oryzae]
MLIEVKSYEQAEELFVKALGLFQDADDETKDTLTYGLGNVYYSSGKLEAAISEFKKNKNEKAPQGYVFNDSAKLRDTWQ